MSNKAGEIEQLGGILPCVVQIGFAGSRDLFGVKDPVERRTLEDQVVPLLSKELAGVHAEFNLGRQHFFCGISQIAIGADMVFTEACGTRPDFLQRIFLPQHREDYLNAKGGDGVADFTEEETQRARGLLATKHIVEECVVAYSANRHERFEEVNLEIARASDLVICLSRKQAEGSSGGTDDLLGRALARKVPTLELEVGLDEQGKVTWTKRIWHHIDQFKKPELPEELLSTQKVAAIPEVGAFSNAMKPVSGGFALGRKRAFTRAAFVIIGTHVFASLIAVVLLVFHDQFSHSCLAAWLPWLVGAELTLLTLGFIMHLLMHRSHAAQRWAFNRMMSEVNRSVSGVVGLHMSLSYLFDLELPQRLRPLLRTLNVLHLRSSKPLDQAEWKAVRSSYLKRVGVQQKYYGDHAREHLWKSKRDNNLFLLFSGTTIAIGGYKLAEHFMGHTDGGGLLLSLMEILGIVGPIAAVGILSYSSAMDHEANAQTYKETLARLDDLEKQITVAKSRNELERLVVETERVLLGENAAWFSRRTFKGIA